MRADHASRALLALAGLIFGAHAAAAQRGVLGLAYQITHAQNYDPSPSPDGRRLVYISVVSGREQLFTMNVDGSARMQLTHDDADHEDPAWSPDGRQIAYVQVKDSLEVIALLSLDGTGTRPVSPAGVRAIHPHWAPDGRSIVYCADDDLHPPRKNPADIFSVDLATGRVTSLITGGVNTYPVWSPDGRHLAFRRMLGGMNSEVFVADADGSGAHNVTNHPAFDGWPAWSPDGTRLAFASNRNSSYQIWVMNADGSGVRLVANTDGRATAPVWSPDGSHLYFPICRNVDFGNDCEIFTVPMTPFVR